MLQEYVKQFNMSYLVAYRLNQDVLENFFGAIRSKGGLNDHPAPKNYGSTFLVSFKIYLQF